MKASPGLRLSLVTVLFVLLVGCVAPDGGFAFGGPECQKVDEKALKWVNWTRVPEVNVRIRNGEFSPMVIRLRQGWPYVLRIRNRDDTDQVFKAFKFFSKVAIIKASIGGEVANPKCIGAFRIPPRETAEIRLVAAVDGHYEVENNGIPFLGGFMGEPHGVIIIEERKPRI
ncbi:MAG: hypothetical protein HQ512_00410 [Rhodospirillales bacterium]|nr:hypothetical protein [Rhodospirillales bacterium]